MNGVCYRRDAGDRFCVAPTVTGFAAKVEEDKNETSWAVGSITFATGPFNLFIFFLQKSWPYYFAIFNYFLFILFLVK
jgi:hypothetical protein